MSSGSAARRRRDPICQPPDWIVCGQALDRVRDEDLDRVAVEADRPRPGRSTARTVSQQFPRLAIGHARSRNSRHRGRHPRGGLDVGQVERHAVAPIEQLQHPDRPGPVDERDRQQRARHIPGPFGGRALEARVGRDVGDRDGLPGREDVAGDALVRRDAQPDDPTSLRARGGAEDESIGRGVVQSDRRGRHTDEVGRRLGHCVKRRLTGGRHETVSRRQPGRHGDECIKRQFALMCARSRRVIVHRFTTSAIVPGPRPLADECMGCRAATARLRRMGATTCSTCGASIPDRYRLCGSCGTPREAEREPIEIRRFATVVNSDLKGSTALGERLDPETLREVLTLYFDEMRLVFESHGGTIEKIIGDAIVAVFGLPVRHDDDALRAVEAAAESQRALAGLNDRLEETWGVRLVVRTGIATGEVVFGEASIGQHVLTGDTMADLIGDGADMPRPSRS